MATTYCTKIILYQDSKERRYEMKGRRPCIHGKLCLAIYKLTGCIYSIRCPYGCKFYEPIKIVEKGDVE